MKKLFQSKNIWEEKIIGKTWVVYKNIDKGKKSVKNYSPFKIVFTSSSLRVNVKNVSY